MTAPATPGASPPPTPSPRVALVTGAGKRLGREIALALSRVGYHLALHHFRSATGAEAVQGEIQATGGTAQLFGADLTDRAAARALIDAVAQWHNRLDLLVLSAANFERIPFAQLDDAAWDRSLGLNAATQFALAHQAAPWLSASEGNVVFITCASTVVPFRNHLPYVVSKAATLQLARTLALELAPRVRVNAVAPGTVLPPEDFPAPAQERLRKAIPLQRLGNPGDVAQAVLYLAQAPFVTGQQILVDGGRGVAAIEHFG